MRTPLHLLTRKNWRKHCAFRPWAIPRMTSRSSRRSSTKMNTEAMTMRLLVTLALDALDDADPQGIKEKVAMDFEKYGGVRVVKVERVEEYQQMTMETAK